MLGEFPLSVRQREDGALLAVGTTRISGPVSPFPLSGILAFGDFLFGDFELVENARLVHARGTR